MMVAGSVVMSMESSLVSHESGKRAAEEAVPTASVSDKKRKVGFSDEVAVMQDGEEQSQLARTMFRRYAVSAVENIEKDSVQIDAIARQLVLPVGSDEHITDEQLSILLGVLCDHVNKLDNTASNGILQAVINLEKWWELPARSLNKYIFFIKVLCSSLPRWWHDVSMVLISSFTMNLDKTVHHHELLQYFFRMIPSSIGLFDSYLARVFPNKNDTQKHLVNYICNVLKLTSYCKELRFQVWSLVVEKIISIDVELQNELDELDDDVDDDLEIDDSDNDDNESSDDSEDETAAPSDEEDPDANLDDDDDVLEGDEEYNIEANQSIKEMSLKLDAILSLISKHLQTEVTPESIDNGDGIGTFNTLITLFKSHILPTYYTRSIQYIMFHISQLQSELMDSFLVTLIDISFSPEETSEKKIKSLQYLGSYIARARKLTRTQIVFVASYLTSWLNRFVLEREEEVDQPGSMNRFKHFYAAFQALCYMFCFRHDLFKDPDGVWECELDRFFQRMIVSKFNPLKYCNENVMMMFSRITQHEGIAYCFGIIESNNNERLRGIIGRPTTNNNSTNVASNSTASSAASTWSLATRQQFIDLQSYFPFDPLFLKDYKVMMKEFYIEWSEAGGDYESDDSDD